MEKELFMSENADTDHNNFNGDWYWNLMLKSGVDFFHHQHYDYGQ